MGLFGKKKSDQSGEQVDPLLAKLGPDAFAELWQSAWNSRMADEVLDLCTNDVIWNDPLTEEAVSGHAQVREYLEATWTAFPDLNFTYPEGPYTADGGVRLALHWRVTGTMEGPLQPPGYAATGKSFTSDGIDLLYLRDGKVFWYFGVFDRQGAAQQLGILPAPGSRAERATVQVQRALAKLRS